MVHHVEQDQGAASGLDPILRHGASKGGLASWGQYKPPRAVPPAADTGSRGGPASPRAGPGAPAGVGRSWWASERGARRGKVGRLAAASRRSGGGTGGGGGGNFPSLVPGDGVGF